MKTFSITVPDETFVKPVIITGFKENVLYGREVSVDEVMLDGKITEVWHTGGQFGFITWDVESMTEFEKLKELSGILDNGRQHPTREYLILVYKNALWIYLRENIHPFG